MFHVVSVGQELLCEAILQNPLGSGDNFQAGCRQDPETGFPGQGSVMSRSRTRQPEEIEEFYKHAKAPYSWAFAHAVSSVRNVLSLPNIAYTLTLGQTETLPNPFAASTPRSV